MSIRLIRGGTADYSVFDQDARESKDILDRLQQNCSLFQQNQDTDSLDTIFNRVYGYSTSLSDQYLYNSEHHPPAPGDELFNRNDPTFHHYDVKNKVCDIGQPACDLTSTASYSSGGLRGFTHPSYQLQQLHTPVNGSELPVYVPLFRPWAADTPSAFVNEFGTVTQRFAQTGYWVGGIQNVTTERHWVYPGTIIRKVFQERNSIYVRTHGMGVNRLWCYNGFGAPIPRIARIVVAFSNDKQGAVTFNTLDRVFIDRFRATNSYPLGQPSGASDEPMSFRDGSSIE